jgi:sporulation protein YlmC with PRC-barrel domain
MKTRVFVRGLLVIGLVGLLCGHVLAAEQSTRSDRETTQQTQQQQTQQQRQQQTQQQGLETMRQGASAPQSAALQRTSKLIGKDVKNTQNEDLGSIYDLVLTSDHQQVSYAALSHGGTWGFGAKYFAIPWSAFQVGPQGDLILSVSKNQLEQASGFDRNNWPVQADTQWLTSTRQGQISGRSSPQTGTRQGTTDAGSAADRQSARSGTQRQSTTMDADSERPMTARTEADTDYGATAMSRDIEYRRVSNLTGTTVTNAEGEDIGDIEDFVIDARRGQVAYTIVSFGGVWGIGEKYSAVPASAIQLNPRRNTARLNADRKTLESIAFDSDEFPDLSNQQYAQRLHEAFNAEPYWTVMGFVGPEQEQAAAQRAWGPEGQFARHFDPKNIETVQGTVQSVGTFQPEGAAPGTSGGLRLRITTDDGNLVTVYGGPQWYAQQHDFYVKPGDKITVTGSETKIGWRPVLVASRIQAGERTLLLRNETGRPQWQVERRGQQGSQGTMQPRSGQGMQRPGDTGQGTQQPGGRTGAGRTQPGQTQPGQQPDR